ncbi:hypothetical protein H6P81_005451 [Aristolochia fimbriata]|uniref:Pectinesterase inhibitor domain-containing protein n=1 Tax=Aristolochia fimbriata TaxID=158543 RepID=A0AAV7EY18_ARIFI|nr:hypothetical protein H6P81_005451 [Aristolochia fimbriata]
MAAKSLVRVLPLLCLVFVSLADAHGISYINRICQRATRANPAIKFDFCVTSLQAVPESHTTEIAGLLKITTDLALKNASRTTDIIKKMGSVACEDLTKHQLDACLGAYGAAVSVLQEATGAFAGGNYAGANLGAALSGATKCDKAFKNVNGDLLAQDNSNLRQLVTIAQTLHRFVTKHSR